MKIYIAGPLSHDHERKAIREMIEIARKRYSTADFYIPMDYKVEGDFQKLDGTWNLPNPIWAERVYKADIEHLNEADLMFALYVGHYCSSGTIWEIGYAKGRGIPVIAYIPDWVNGDVSLMVMNGFDGYITKYGTINKFTYSDLSKYNQK